jgi:hypothetical protein
MGAPTIKRTALGTIDVIRKVYVDALSTKFALVTPEDGCARLAIRIGLNLTADGEDYFSVGDKVRFTVLVDPTVDFPRAQDLVKFTHGDGLV